MYLLEIFSSIKVSTLCLCSLSYALSPPLQLSSMNNSFPFRDSFLCTDFASLITNIFLTLNDISIKVFLSKSKLLNITLQWPLLYLLLLKPSLYILTFSTPPKLLSPRSVMFYLLFAIFSIHVSIIALHELFVAVTWFSSSVSEHSSVSFPSLISPFQQMIKFVHTLESAFCLFPICSLLLMILSIFSYYLTTHHPSVNEPQSH